MTKNHELKTLKDLNPAPYNPRKISEEALAGLSVSTKQFGDISGIVWNKRTGRLVAGHQRVKVLKDAGAKMKRGRIELPEGRGTFPVRVVDWDIKTEKAASISANNHLIAGEFLDDDRSNLLGDIEDLDHFEDLRLGDLRDEFLPEEPVDFEKEWEGMPEFDQKDKTAFRTFPVHFKNQEAVDKFAKLIDQNITEKTRFVWFPEIEIEKYADKSYTDES